MPLVTASRLARSAARAVAFFAALDAAAAGLLVPVGGDVPLRVEAQDVEVEIFDALAVTQVRQVFRNDGPAPLEAVYSFPLPDGASIAGFSLFLEGREMVGEVLPRERARAVYDELVRPDVPAGPSGPRKLVDPGLVEEVSHREVRARVFPVPAHGTQEVRLTYHELLPVRDDARTWTYPLETRAFDRALASEPLTLAVRVRSSVPIEAVATSETGSDGAVTHVLGPHRSDIFLERASGSLDEDVVVRFRLARGQPGLDVVSHRVPGEDGTLLLLATAPSAGTTSEGPLDVTLVVDVSGSMRHGGRLAAAGRLLSDLLAAGREEDRFNAIAFNVEPVALAARPLGNDAASRRELRRFLSGFRGVGGTDLMPALDLALGWTTSGRDHVLVVVTDGGLNASDEDHGRFLARLEGEPVRVFGVAVGNDANVPLLRSIAAATGGESVRISTRGDVAGLARALARRLRQAPLSGLQLEVEGGVTLHEVAPSALPPLFPGSQLAAWARYDGTGMARFRLTGWRSGRREVLETVVDLPAEAPLHPELRRGWARARVDDLLQAVRSGREEAVAVRELTRLGVEHSIVTPFTSLLVLESDDMYAARGIARRSHALLEHEAWARRRRSAALEKRVQTSGDVELVRAPARPVVDSLGGGASGPTGLLAALLFALASRGRRARVQP